MISGLTSQGRIPGIPVQLLSLLIQLRQRLFTTRVSYFQVSILARHSPSFVWLKSGAPTGKGPARGVPQKRAAASSVAAKKSKVDTGKGR